MATDLAEVIGSAIALKLLFHIPLIWGVLITGFDVLIILMWGFNAKHMRVFEIGIALLVLTTAVCLFIVWKYSNDLTNMQGSDLIFKLCRLLERADQFSLIYS